MSCDPKETQMPTQTAISSKSLSIIIDGETKEFHDKNKFTQYLSTNPALKRIMNEKHQKKRETAH